MRRLFAGLLAAALLVPGAAAEEGAKPEINRPYLVDTDVERWKKGFESEGREVYAKRMEIVDAVAVKPGMAVADIGAGTGLFTMLFAKAVKPGGRVYAVDISTAFIELIEKTAKAQGVDNVTAILGDGTGVGLADASVDLAYLSDVYHHFERPAQTLAAIRRAIKPGGRMMVIDYERIPGVTPPSRIAHLRLDKETAIREIEAAGFTLVEEKKLMQENYFVVFRRP